MKVIARAIRATQREAIVIKALSFLGALASTTGQVFDTEQGASGIAEPARTVASADSSLGTVYRPRIGAPTSRLPLLAFSTKLV